MILLDLIMGKASLFKRLPLEKICWLGKG